MFKLTSINLNIQYYAKKSILKLKELFSEEKTEQKLEDIEDDKQTWEKQDTIWVEIMEGIKKYLKLNCPVCKKG